MGSLHVNPLARAPCANAACVRTFEDCRAVADCAADAKVWASGDVRPLRTVQFASEVTTFVSQANKIDDDHMTSLCVVLHMCWRTRLIDDYSYAAAQWNTTAAVYPRLGVYFVDSCRNLTEEHPFQTDFVHRLPFQQRHAARSRNGLTNFEMDQVAAALKLLPPQCTHIVKLTGKYHSETLPSYLAELQRAPPVLAVQARGPSWYGWSSELYVISRRLLSAEIRARRGFGNAEQWLEHIRATIEALDMPVHRLPRFNLSRHVRRSGDNALMKWL